MKIELDVSQVWSNTFNIQLDRTPYVDFAREFLNNTNVEHSGYYNWLKTMLSQNGKVWNYIVTEEQCLKRAVEFRNLAISIKENGLNNETNYFFIDTFCYGPITGQIIRGRYWIVDGNHRAAILIALGHSKITIDMTQKMYQDSFPVITKLRHVPMAWAGKSIVEIGCNIGQLGHLAMKNNAKSYVGYDLINEYIEEGRSRYPDLNLKCADASSLLIECDLLVALGVFHHMSDEGIINMMNNVVCDEVLFEVPYASMPFKDYKIRTKEWYIDLFKNKGFSKITEFEYGFSYPIDRTIFLCKTE